MYFFWASATVEASIWQRVQLGDQNQRTVGCPLKSPKVTEVPSTACNVEASVLCSEGLASDADRCGVDPHEISKRKKKRVPIIPNTLERIRPISKRLAMKPLGNYAYR